MLIIIVLLLAAAAWYFIPCGICRTKPSSGSSMCPNSSTDPVPTSLNDCIAMYKCPTGSPSPSPLVNQSTAAMKACGDGSDIYFKFTAATDSDPAKCSSVCVPTSANSTAATVKKNAKGDCKSYTTVLYPTTTTPDQLYKSAQNLTTNSCPTSSDSSSE